MNQHFEHALSRLQQQHDQFQEKSSSISRWRLTTFILALVIPYIVYPYYDTGAQILLLVGFILFSFLIYQHKQVSTAEAIIEKRLIQTRTRIAKSKRIWQDMPHPFPNPLTSDHPYAKDLNLFGEKSLHRLIDSSLSEIGSKKLADFLLTPAANPSIVVWRQNQIRGFRSMLYGLDKIRIGLENKLGNRKKKIELEDILGWVSQAESKESKVRIPLLIGIGLVSLGCLLFEPARMIFPLIWVSYIFMYSNSRKAQPNGFWHLEDLSSKLSIFSHLYGAISNFSSNKDPEALKRLRSKEGHSIAGNIKWVSTMMSLSQSNPITFLIFNAFFPWDLVADRALEKLRIKMQSWLPDWLNHFAEFETLYSLAEFSMLHSDYEFPQISDSERFSAQELKHCMILSEESVGNTVDFDASGKLILITGSNMAGKSTFLRTLGTNMILANAGSTVAGKNVVFSPFEMFSSMGVGDSVTDGISFFYAEVRRLKSMLDWLQEKQSDKNAKPALILIDEIFKGTNNRERYEGSKSIILQLVGLHGVAFVSTHDLDLATLDKQDNRISNSHFRETIQEEQMVFSYKIHDGPCPTTNALKIMKISGLLPS